MINTYILEFIAIVEYLKNEENSVIKGDSLIVEKSKVIKLMNKNAYETSEKKLLVWRDLQWIVTDEDRLTRRIRQNGKTIAAIKIRLKVHRMIQNLMENANEN